MGEPYDSLVPYGEASLRSSRPPVRRPNPLFRRAACFLDYLRQHARSSDPGAHIDARDAHRSADRWLAGDDADRRPAAARRGDGDRYRVEPGHPGVPWRDRFRGDLLHSADTGTRCDFGAASPGRWLRKLGGARSHRSSRIPADVTVSVRVRRGGGTPRASGTSDPAFRRDQPSAHDAAARRLKSTARLGELRRGASPLPRPPEEDGCPDVPLIGFHLTDAIRERAIRLAPALEFFSADGVRFVDGNLAPFDAVILATGTAGARAARPSGDARSVRLRAARPAGREPRATGPVLRWSDHDRRGALFNIGRDARSRGNSSQSQSAV